MKKIFSSAILFVTACLVFTSCAEQLSNLSVIKRHYKNGYYVNFNNNNSENNSKPVISQTEEIKSALEKNNTYASVSKKEDVKEITLENKAEVFDRESPISAGASIADRKFGNATQSIAPTKAAPDKKLTRIPAKIKNIVSENKDQHKRRGGAGGLLWLIIVILLVLFLLGLLSGGFGGLIYLILVIALVLLLLKILGIL